MSDKQAIKEIIQSADRHIWVITTVNNDGKFGGLVATWVSSNSIDDDQPGMMIAIGKNHFTAELIDSSKAFALHLLGESHIQTAWNFALGSGRDRDKMANVDFRLGTLKVPILEECDSWLECRVIARLEAADRIYYWADVVDGDRRSSDDGPLLTASGLIKAASGEQLKELKASMHADLEVQRPMMERWRADLPPYLRP